MRRSRLFAVGVLFLSFAWVLAGGCSSSNPEGAGPSNGPTAGSGGGMQGDPTIFMPGTATGDSGLVDGLNPLCGVGMGDGGCLPDDAKACSTYMPPEPGGGGGGGGESSGGESSGGGAGANAGGASQGGNGSGGDGGVGIGGDAAGGASGEGGASLGGAGAGGEGGSGAASPSAPYSCQVTRQNQEVLRQCVPAGAGTVNAPCFSASDCAPSYACVTENDAGRCLPYCCDQNSTCTSGTFCAERPLRLAESDTNNSASPRVPVCVPADACSLEDPFPCPSGSECRFKGDTACMVVRDDGTTTCVKPGTGQQGDACPCAWNHVCSSVTHQCIKICRTDPTKDDCGMQKCQASSELPQNFGVCVGPLK
jgi:hypothetical protein